MLTRTMPTGELPAVEPGRWRLRHLSLFMPQACLETGGSQIAIGTASCSHSLQIPERPGRRVWGSLGPRHGTRLAKNDAGETTIALLFLVPAAPDRAAHSPWQARPKNRVPDVQIITQTKSSLSSCWRWSASAASPWTPLRALCGQGEGGCIGGPKINNPPFAREENTMQRCKLAHVQAHMHAHEDHTHKDHPHLPAPVVAQTSRSARTSRLAP